MSTNGQLRREALTYHETLPRVSSASYTRLSDLTPEGTDWLWYLRIPAGDLTIPDGDPSVNKSSLLMDLAARVSTGREMPDGTAGTHGGVLLGWIDRLRATECARSEDGLIWAIILRGDPEMEQTRAYFAGEKIHGDAWREATWQDNRGKDHNTIDSVLALLKRIKEGETGSRE